MGGGGYCWSPKKLFWPFWASFGLKIRGDGHQDPSPESTTDLNVVG